MPKTCPASPFKFMLNVSTNYEIGARITSLKLNGGAKMTDTSDRELLIHELEADGDLYFSGGFWNNIFDSSLAITCHIDRAG